MFEDDLKTFLASKVADGTIMRGDLTEVNETTLTGEALVVVYNAGTQQTKEKYIFLYKENNEIKYYVLKKGNEPLEPVTAKQDGLITTTSASTPVSIDGLSFDLTSGQRYHFQFMGVYQSSELTTGVGFVFTAPAVSNSHWALTVQTSSSGANQMLFGGASSLTSPLTSTSVAATLTDYMWKVEGFCTPSEDGTLQLCCKSEVEGSQIGIKNVGIGILTPVV